MHILVNDFIGGFLDRGMPLYVRNLIDGLKQEGFRVSVVRAPRVCRVLPRSLFYLVCVLVEQTILPVIGYLKRADITLYAYNSAAIIDLLNGRGRMVVHDLEQLDRRLSPSKLYYIACYCAVRRLKRPFFTISELTRQRLKESGRFGAAAITILPNTFYAFESLLGSCTATPGARTKILLCTGSTANKDLESIVADHIPKLLAAGFGVSILGLHKTADTEKLAPVQHAIASGTLRICGKLSDREVVAEYRSHQIVWVHSLREGFGRCLVEGRLAGARVVCSHIPEFVGLRDPDVHFYEGSADLVATVARLQEMPLPAASYTGYPYRALLRQAIGAGL